MSTFLSTFLKDPYVAALRPSSRTLSRRIVRMLTERGVRRVVEFGPGDGAVTVPLLAALPRDATYVAVERNPAFAARIRGIGDPRLVTVEGSVLSSEGAAPVAEGTADAVIASIPFSMLTPEEREEVMRTAERLLRPGGICVVFHQYTPVMQPVMRRAFGDVRTVFEPRNVFPCFVFASQKP